MQDENSNANHEDSAPSIWVRFIYMVLFAFLFAISETVLYVIAVIGLIQRLFNKPVNSNVASVGRSIGLFVQQIAEYLSFNTEKKPFPFSSWPTGNGDQTSDRESSSE